MAETTRRTFLASAACAAAATAGPLGAAPRKHVPVSTNQYPWLTFYRREGRNFNAELDAALSEIAASGLDGLEPLVRSEADIDRLVPLLKKHGLSMRSLYVNTVLYDQKRAPDSIENVLSIARKARAAGTRIIVTNPSPIRWGGTADKNDTQLEVQAKALNELGGELKKLGLTLGYHNHDSELRKAAREFHHMLVGTDPSLVGFCLDAHWIYRGAGNSSVALFDVVKLYGDRIVELHLRQSKGGVWTEVFGPGDIDYARLARELRNLGIKPHLVLEQAVEAQTPKTLTALEAHKRGVKQVRRIFSIFA